MLMPLPGPRSRSATTTRTATATQAGPHPTATRLALEAASTAGPCPPRVSAWPAHLCEEMLAPWGQVACCKGMMHQLYYPDFVDEGTRKRGPEPSVGLSSVALLSSSREREIKTDYRLTE